MVLPPLREYRRRGFRFQTEKEGEIMHRLLLEAILGKLTVDQRGAVALMQTVISELDRLLLEMSDNQKKEQIESVVKSMMRLLQFIG
jgi:hypothetical protein